MPILPSTVRTNQNDEDFEGKQKEKDFLLAAPTRVPARPLAKAHSVRIQSRPGGGGSKRGYDNPKATNEAVRKAMEEVAREAAIARRRARACVAYSYWVLKSTAVATHVLMITTNVWVLARRHEPDLRERAVRGYLIPFSLAALLAELDTRFARDNFRALQKWWCKALFYVFLGTVNLGWTPLGALGRPLTRLQLATAGVLCALALGNVALYTCLRRLLEKTVLRKLRKAKALKSGDPTAKSSSSRRKSKGTSRHRSSAPDAGYGSVAGRASPGDPETVPERSAPPQATPQQHLKREPRSQWWLEGPLGGGGGGGGASGGSIGDGGDDNATVDSLESGRASQSSRWWEEDAYSAVSSGGGGGARSLRRATAAAAAAAGSGYGGGYGGGGGGYAPSSYAGSVAGDAMDDDDRMSVVSELTTGSALRDMALPPPLPPPLPPSRGSPPPLLLSTLEERPPRISCPGLSILSRREPPPLATRPEMPADPLGAGSSDAGGSYFNEDLLRQRQARAATYGSTYPYDANEQGAILGRAGSMVSAAKSGAKSLLQRANGYGNTGGGAGGVVAGGSYDVTFGDGRLGFTMLKSEQGLGVVCKVQPDSTAATAGVSPGDTVVAINRRRMSSYDEVMSVLPSMPRPVLVTFAKPDGDPQLANGQAALTGGGAWEADGQGSKGWLGNLDPFKSGKRRSSAGLSGDNASWRVDNQDLQFRRPDFHGVVVHAYNGVFSWSLYGTSDGSEAPGARLSTGDTYTEYVMRCQWGPDLQHMSPWMVARRYREFDALDKDLREVFPHLKDSFPSLPPKELFKTSQEVVSRRRVGLEQYMTFLIGNCPDVLCCPQMNRFLGINERIAAIKGQGGLRRGSSGAPAGGGGGGGGAAVPSLSASTSSGAALVGTDYLLNLMTAGEAYDLMRARAGALRPLTRAGLQAVEEAVRRLRQRVDNWGRGVAVVADPLHDAELHGLAEICQQSWPALKATAARADDTPEGMDMLPSVLQCDEDIERLLAWLSVLCRSSLTGQQQQQAPLGPQAGRLGAVQGIL